MKRTDHIFEKSACLTKRQVREYATGAMSREEVLVVEHHLICCDFCNDAIEGLTPELLANQDSHFLKEQLSLIHPQVYLNSISPATTRRSLQQRRAKPGRFPVVKSSTILSALVLTFGVLWYIQYGKDMAQNTQQKPHRQAVQAQNETHYITHTPVNEPQPVEEAAKVKKQEVVSVPATTEVAPAEVHINKAEEPQKKEDAADIQKIKSIQAPSASTPSVQPKKEPEKRSVAAITENTSPKPDQPKATAAELYADGNYSAALVAYKTKMNANGTKEEQKATLQAADCYLKLGQTANARQLIQNVADNGNGAPRRQARRQLKALEKNSEG